MPVRPPGEVPGGCTGSGRNRTAAAFTRRSRSVKMIRDGLTFPFQVAPECQPPSVEEGRCRLCCGDAVGTHFPAEHQFGECFLSHEETEALLAVPDKSTVLGRRDHLLLLVAMQSGLRVSELIALICVDAELGTSAHLRCTGKDRKERCTPLTKLTARLLQRWITARNAAPGDPLFPNRVGGHLSRDAVADLLRKHLPAAAERCPAPGQQERHPRTHFATLQPWHC